MFALVDCNNFYASCERLFKPYLNNKPVVVLSNNDGCVIARSNEAKKLGIPMGAVAFKYQEVFDKHKIHVFSSNYALYGDLSNRVMNILTSYTPDIEIYSIDEAFLQFNGFDNYCLKEYGAEIQSKVKQWTSIPISIGFAPTKGLSKVANRIAKKFPEYHNGVYIMDSEEKRIKALKWLQVDDIWGIGRQYAKKLHKYGIHNAYQFTQQHDDWVKKEFSIVGLRLKRDLSGEPTLSLEDSIKAKKNISTTRSFDKNTKNRDIIKERVCTYANSCAEKLRKQGSHCNALLVFLNTNPHRNDLPQYRRSTIVKLPYPSSSSITLTKYTKIAFEKIFKKEYQYKKAGVIALDIVPENNYQINLFENENPKHKLLMEVIDLTNKVIGQKKVKLANQDLGRTWKMRQERLSPRYTSSWSELLEV
ncbi:DNA polymerase V catalytic protein [Tenacibaculum sp. 190524A02b]|uniref:Y-family DNA polymerase n=1 Tax=Tenacibaculum vairaonense TaxID=3137860 RepID=UPI0032B248E2